MYGRCEHAQQAQVGEVSRRQPSTSAYERREMERWMNLCASKPPSSQASHWLSASPAASMGTATATSTKLCSTELSSSVVSMEKAMTRADVLSLSNQRVSLLSLSNMIHPHPRRYWSIRHGQGELGILGRCGC